MESMPLAVTALYAGLNFIGTIVLAVLVVRQRLVTKTPIGDGGNKAMIKAIRAHNNNLEYVPIVIILLAILELNGLAGWALHALGAGLTVARILHPVGLYKSTSTSFGRFWGTLLTWLVILIAAILAMLQPFL